MDPVTQGVVGAIAAQASGLIKRGSHKKQQALAKAGLIGALGGMAPDLDILIQSSTDSLLSLEYHRQFTHSLFFIPIGALLCCLLLYALLHRPWQTSFRQFYIWSLFGFATHGLLDACTSYGTQLFWPVSNIRISWDIISIIDPLFTLPLLFLVLLSAKTCLQRYACLSLAWATLYLSFGLLQNERALTIGHALAAERGHDPARITTKPSFANLAVWKIIYEADNTYYVDAVKPGLFGKTIWPGDSIKKLDLARDLPWLDADSQQAEDIERFSWFSAGYVALDPEHADRIIDIRYSMLPNEISALWGIHLNALAAPDDYVQYYSARGATGSRFQVLWKMIVE